MAVEKTNKEYLEIILEQTKLNAQNQLTFAGQVSKFMNEQANINTEIKSYLENNVKTNQRGIVEQVKVNTNDIIEMKNEKKIQRAKDGFLGGIVASAIAGILKFIM